ncbi:MAG: hypothetical protein ACRC8S_03515 [Fimbriiglobus sp.]
MRRSWATLTALFLVLTLPLTAREQPSIPTLINQLGSSDYLDRDAAQAKLIKMGSAAIAELELAAKTHESAEIRERCSHIAAEARKLDEGSKYLAIKKVRLIYRNMPLNLAVTDLATKTGTNMKLEVKDGTRLVTVETAELPIWEAIEAFRVAAKLTERFREDAPLSVPEGEPYASVRRSYYYDGSNQSPETANQVPIVWVDGEASALSADRRGIVRVTAMPGRFPANRLIRGAGQAIIHLDLALTSSLNWQDATQVRIDRAEDDIGRPVSPAHRIHQTLNETPYGNPFFGGFGGYNQQMPAGNPRLVPVTLRTDDRQIRKLRLLEGSIVGEVGVPNQTILTIDNLKQASGRSFVLPNDAKLEVKKYEARADGTATLSLHTEIQYTFQQMRGQRARMQREGGLGLKTYRFTDVDGKVVVGEMTGSNSMTSSTGFSIMETSDSTITFAKNKSQPVKMEVNGTRMLSLEIPFSLRDVSMP